ncbi:MAG: glycosyltransferase family 39 protein [candidate division KSB1 bacterium]|nr:glycosyltransferase family 39 protein [candidate division KSB1 bacterium]
MIDPNTLSSKHKKSQFFLLLLILGAGAFFRFYGIDAQLPYLQHPDEPIYVEISRTIFQTGDLNPHFFKYPSLFFYLRTLAYIPFYYTGKIAGAFDSPGDIMGIINLTMGVSKAQTPSLIIFDRSITVFFGVLSIFFVFLIGTKMLRNRYFALLPALFLALFRSNLYLDKVIAPDTFLLFFLLLTAYYTLCLFETPSRKNYILAGLSAGLAISVKYNGGLILLPILIAHLILEKKKALKNINIYIAIAATGLGFILTSPFALLDFNTFIHDFYFEMMHYSKVGHIGMQGNTLQWYASYLYKYVGIIILSLALLQIIKGLWNFTPRLIIFASFPVVYFIMVARILVRNERTIFLIVPFIFILAVGFISDLISSKNSRLQTSAGWIGLLLLILPLYHHTNAAVYVSKNYYYSPNHDLAREWINANIPENSKIVLESYSPFISPEKYNITGLKRIINQDIDWYLEENVDYIIVSDMMYSRFFKNPEQYKREHDQYQHIFNKFQHLKTFDKQGRPVQIFKVTEKTLHLNNF